jgi:hypothetical protein
MVLNAAFNNTSVISRRSVLLVEENGVQEKKNEMTTAIKSTYLHI